MKACVITLGCKVNETESASLMSRLEELGYETTDELCKADLYLLNTCAVTAEAERKSRQTLSKIMKYNADAPVAVFGCAAQNNPQSFQRGNVTFVSGAQGKDAVIGRLLSSARGVDLSAEAGFCELPDPKRTKTRAFLRIQDGCNRFCSYCLIPYLRGRSRSRAAGSVLQEAKRCGAKEIVLTGIDLSSYRDNDVDLGALLKMLGGVPARIRLGSLEAGVITREFLSSVKEAGNVQPHFHLSLQSGSDRVLRAMNRHYTRREYLEKCALIYEFFPDAAITTDIIVGFPAETEEDFRLSLSITEEAGFARIHAFPFSPREGTAAAKREDLPHAVKKERTARMLEAGRIAEEKYLSRFSGREATVLFEADGGYTENYIRVYAEGAEEGKLCRVRLQERKKDGLSAEIIEEI